MKRLGVLMRGIWAYSKLRPNGRVRMSEFRRRELFDSRASEISLRAWEHE